MIRGHEFISGFTIRILISRPISILCLAEKLLFRHKYTKTAQCFDRVFLRWPHSDDISRCIKQYTLYLPIDYLIDWHWHSNLIGNSSKMFYRSGLCITQSCFQALLGQMSVPVFNFWIWMKKWTAPPCWS